MFCRICQQPTPKNELTCYQNRCEMCHAVAMEFVAPTAQGMIASAMSDRAYTDGARGKNPGRTAIEPATYLKLSENSCQ